MAIASVSIRQEFVGAILAYNYSMYSQLQVPEPVQYLYRTCIEPVLTVQVRLPYSYTDICTE